MPCVYTSPPPRPITLTRPHPPPAIRRYPVGASVGPRRGRPQPAKQARHHAGDAGGAAQQQRRDARVARARGAGGRIGQRRARRAGVRRLAPAALLHADQPPRVADGRRHGRAPAPARLGVAQDGAGTWPHRGQGKIRKKHENVHQPGPARAPPSLIFFIIFPRGSVYGCGLHAIALPRCPTVRTSSCTSKKRPFWSISA